MYCISQNYPMEKFTHPFVIAGFKLRAFTVAQTALSRNCFN